MTKTELVLLTDKLEERKKTKRWAQTAARNMMHQLHIADSDNIVFAFGQSRAQNNYQAILNWLLGKIKDGHTSHDRYVEFRNELSKVLDRYSSEAF